MKSDDLYERFRKLYGSSSEDVHIFYAPGRVNLIGEHTDYNGGYVFPCALNFGTAAAVRKRNDKTLKFASTNFELRVTVDDDLSYKKEHGWANYPKGIVKYFRQMGFDIGGFEVLYCGEIPNGAGLSSSASIELVTAVMIKGLYGCSIDMIDMVKLSQNVENNFVGVNCGIMDQFSIGMGKEGHAVLLNCSTLDYKYVPLKLNGYRIVISNTNRRRGLADSKYNERRSECERAVACINRGIQNKYSDGQGAKYRAERDIRYLAELDAEVFESYSHFIEEENILKRARHVVYENTRVLQAVKKLDSGDLYGFGLLMNDSHISLRDLYEVTGFELDTLVEEAWKLDGVLGSRMTGAGFGGCTVSIVIEDAVDEFKAKVGENYNKKTGLSADFYTAIAGDGAKELFN